MCCVVHPYVIFLFSFFFKKWMACLIFFLFCQIVQEREPRSIIYIIVLNVFFFLNGFKMSVIDQLILALIFRFGVGLKNGWPASFRFCFVKQGREPSSMIYIIVLNVFFSFYLLQFGMKLPDIDINKAETRVRCVSFTPLRKNVTSFCCVP